MVVSPQHIRRVKLAVASERRLARTLGLLEAASHALYSGVWLGILDDIHFPAVTAAYYADSERYHSDYHNLSGLFLWEREAVESAFPKASSVLVPSAGGGREIIALAMIGHNVVGCEPSPQLVEYGRALIEERGLDAELLLSPPNRLPTNLDGRFECVLIGWGSYSHVNGRVVRVEFLRDLRRRVAAGAPMIVSFTMRSTNSRSFRIARTIGGAIRKLRRSREAIEPGDFVLPDYLHYFTREEVESELVDGGFVVTDFAESPYPHAICRAVQ